MTSNTESDLLAAREKLLRVVDSFDQSPAKTALDEIWSRAGELEKSASGSWLGYHANVYFENFNPPPAGVHFDVEHGTGGAYYGVPERRWIEHTSQSVVNRLVDEAGKAALAAAEEAAESARKVLTDVKGDVSSILTVYLKVHDDFFVRRVSEEIDNAKVLNFTDIVNDLSPKRKIITSDMHALQQGIWAPPHIKVRARITAAHQPTAHCRQLAEQLEKLAAHMGRARKLARRSASIGTNVFIGHGRSQIWRDLKDFVKDRLRLPYDEFNRVPVAGVTNIARLSEMLDSAACAFVIMTAEDELADGKTHARMNVIHEVGLFQGRLGFTKAIVLIEDGCEEFSNIQGLGQIRFPRGDISAKFEEVRLVLEREGLLDSPNAA